MKENIFENRQVDEIKKCANFEGNETLLFYERLQNPEIREQLINTYLKYYDTQDKPLLMLEYDEKGNSIDVTDKWQKTVKTREQINQELEQKIKSAFSQTGIDYSKDGMSCMNDIYGYGTIYLHASNPQTGEKYSQKQLSITEAHEKGHFFRDFLDAGKLFKTEIREGFDFSEVEIDNKHLEKIKKESKFEEPTELIIRNVIDYFEMPIEIMERMAQLKNYFGMKGSEKFTKQHLDYAKENYIKDTGMPDSQIKPFLDAITPETEEKFLHLINTLGI